MQRADYVVSMTRPLLDMTPDAPDLTKTPFENMKNGGGRGRGARPRKSSVGAIKLGTVTHRGPSTIRQPWKRASFPSPVPTPPKRRCMVKITYSGPLRRSSASVGADGAVHPNAGKIAYIARESATTEPRPWYAEPVEDGRALFTYDSCGRRVGMDGAEASEHIGDGPVFRIILSPEHGEECNLDLLAKRFMEESFSRALHIPASRIRYVAATHWNTASPHVHIIVSRSLFNFRKGEGSMDSLARYSGSYLKSHRAVNDASRICNEIAGPRTWALDSVEERFRSASPRIQPVDLRIMELGKIQRDGSTVITDEQLKDVGPKFRKDAMDRLFALSRSTLGWAMKVEREQYAKPDGRIVKGFRLSPGYWTRARILDGDVTLPVTKEELDRAVIEKDGYMPEGIAEKVSQDDSNESMLYVRVRGKDGRIYLAHVKDAGWNENAPEQGETVGTGKKSGGINGTAAVPRDDGMGARS